MTADNIIRKRVHRTKRFFSFLAAAVILSLTAAGTAAWLTDASGAKKNLFQPAEVSCEVVEDFDQTQKTNVSAKNTGNVSAYIRMALVPSWMDDAGNIAAVPVSLSGDLEFSGLCENGSGWIPVGNYYYYSKPVPAGVSAGDYLFDSCSVRTGSAGYRAGYQMNLSVLAEAVQAEGGAVQNVWPVSVASDGTLSARNEGGGS